MHAIVIGGDGNLARVLMPRLVAGGNDAVATTRGPLSGKPTLGGRVSWVHCDLRDVGASEALWAVRHRSAYSTIYIMAAITGIMRCETDPDAWRVNAEAPLLIALRALPRHHVVFMSSGTVERAQHTALARQKAYADHAVLMRGGCVVRPLPFVAPDKYDEVAALLVKVGRARVSGVVRWEG